MMKNKVLLFIGLFIMTLLVSGCGDDDISIPLGENGESISVGGNEEDGFTFETENEDGESFSLSSSKEIPEEFPSEIPFPDKYEVFSTSQINDNGDEGITVSYLTESMTFDEVWEMYQVFKEEHGYENVSEMKMDGMNSMTMNKGDDGMSVNVIPDEEGKQITVTITYFKKAETTE
ncbi:hypothetical protein GH741_00255 [Aquibacillus halophilus]|uniref:Lipoprotein n=1 Tax=Aquibacillus halophilus TaxID=930132 RepID=A0A6A8D5W1_9BACI|nr:hypothetical protein [Aquibacillus halophilus]MRH41103.1 hypothetical protein [Aquibacillus halophilus]